MPSRSSAGHFAARVTLDPEAPTAGYPFDLPVVRWLREHGGLHLYRGVTFLVGDNGSGKSTLIEAIAVALGLNPEGGSKSFRFATRASESELGAHLRVARHPGRERTSFFLRAESYYNVATEVENIGFGLPDAFGGSPHERSHGESFVALLQHRFGPRGFYLLDEPEAALSVTGALAVLRRMAELAAQGSQFVVATHSPILLALPGATILELDDDGIRRVDYDDAGPVVLTRGFLADPQAFLRHLG